MKYTSSITHRDSLIFSFKFWLVTILLLLIYTSMLFAQYTSTVYLDPTNSGDPGENGTIEHPYDHISDVSISSNTQYLFKTGTTMEISSTIIIGSGVNYIKFSNYGAGVKPIIHKTTSGSYNFRISHSTTDIVIESIDIKGYAHAFNGGVTTGIYMDVGMYGGIKNIMIRDCDVYNHGVAISSSYFGDPDIYTDSVSVVNCNVYDIGLDGIFFRNTRYALVEGCHIYDVNLYWHTSGSHEESPSGGDCIQITRGAYDFKIYNNIMDRRSTGNKFCFIFGGYDTWMGVRGEIIGNTFYPPKDTTDDHGGGVFFISQHATQYVKIERNYFSGKADNKGNKHFRGLATIRADTTLFNYNIIDSIGVPGNIPGQSGYCEYAEVNNNTIVSGGHTGIFDIMTVSPNTYAEVKNNLTAGDGDHPLIYIMNVPSVDESNNIQLQGSNTNIYNSTLSIVNWETSNFHRTSNLNDGLDVGMQYDFDSVFVSNPPELGVCEFIDGGQTNTAPTINNQAFSIEENTTNGGQVGLIIATDPDQGQTLTYSIQSGNTDNAFQVNSNTGELTVNNSEALDYETNPEFNLTVQVQDNGAGSLTAQAIITVSLIDLNEIPEIEDQYFNLDEIGSDNQLVGIVEASDPDYGQALTFSILSGNINDAFQIISNTGGLTINNIAAIDYETNPEFNLSIQVQDNGSGSLTNQAIITIFIVDINEPPNILNQEFTILVDLNNLEADINNNELNIGEIQAFDPDIGQSITFQILEGNDRNAFSLNSNTGGLIISDPYALYLFEYYSYPLVVMVQDDSPEQLQASATVNVYVNIDTVSMPDRASELLLSKEVDKDIFSMKVFPNPVWNYFEIELNNLDPGLTSILMFNTAGEIISRDDFFCNESKYIQKYNVDNFRKGLYLIQIRNNYAVYYSKIVKM